MKKHDGCRIGVDGGGTRVRATARCGDVETARVEGGPVNPNRVGVEAARGALAQALRDLKRREPRISVAAGACVGLAGRSHPDVADVVSGAFQDAGISVEGPRILCSDAELVLWAAFGDARPSGVAVVAGTGSAALARGADGRLARAGGYGAVLGDEGGGHWIGVQALKVALRHVEEAAAGSRVRPSILVDEIHAALGAESLASAPAATARGALKPSTLAPAVVKAAERGDRDADDILRRAGEELAGLVCRAATGAGLHGAFPVRGAGGVLAGAARVVTALVTRLGVHRPEAVFTGAECEPVDGAFALLDHATREKTVPPGW
ncbi:MAG TPA: BadF/BadG/BcrA/BcrD ATPase family protein [Planctomycetota bacterium]|nr:BadF/BadG/BcrA/BcrD ATPase family protein [Planctomycetota bacterium]